MIPSLVLFAAVLVGAYAGFLSNLTGPVWLSAALLSAVFALCVPSKNIRALLVIACAFALAAALAKHRLDAFEKREARLPKGQTQLEGIVEEVIPTLFQGKKLIFKADAGFRLRVSLEDGAAHVPVQAGDRVRLYGQVKHVHHAMMPGDFDAYWFALARGFEGRLSIHNPFRVRVLKQRVEHYFWADLRKHLRERFSQALKPREAAVLLALMIGETDFFEPEQKQIYQTIGAGHLLAVSGLQVSCLSFLFFWFFKIILLLLPGVGRLSRARTPAVILTLISIWTFTALCGASASAIRAALMNSVVLVGLLLRRDTSLLEAFGIAGFMTVLFMPTTVLDPSFLFSYLAIFGLLISGVVLAGVVTLPLSAYYFGAIAIGGLLANLILVPMAVFLQTPAIFLAVLGFFKPAVYLAGSLEALCEALGQYIGGLWWLTPPHAWQVLGFVIGCALFAYRRYTPGLILCSLIWVPNISWEPRGVQITVLPVGQGDSSVFKFPNRQIMVVDGGPREEYLLNFLRRTGIKKVDILVLSHPDADHIMGFFKVLENIQVSEIWHSGFNERHVLMRRLLELAHQRQIPIRVASDLLGDHDFAEAKITILFPTKLDESQSTNNNSLVLKISLGNQSALWPGDLESEPEQQATSIWRATVLKAPHHGSKSSSSEHLVREVNPRHVIFCTQAENQFGFPNPDIKKRWQEAGAKLWDTGTQGAIQIRMTSTSTQITSFL